MSLGVERPISHDFPRVSTKRVVGVAVAARDTARRLHESQLFIDVTQRVSHEIKRARHPKETTQANSIPQEEVIFNPGDFVEGQPGLSIYEL